MASTHLAGRTVVVSGGTGTLGRPICTALAAAGANVVVNDVNKAAVDEFVTSIKSQGHAVLGVPLSATSGTEIVDRAIQEFSAIHAVINATLGPIPWKPFDELTAEDIRLLFDSNVIGPLEITKAAWKHFKAQRSGRVVNFTSDSVLGMPTAAAYTLSKGALFGVNKTLAMEGAPFNIKVNCVSPVAYKPAMDPKIKHFSDNVLHAFRTRYTPEANVPMILALVTEQCPISGEVLQTAGGAVGRSVWAAASGENGMDTVESCLQKVADICKRGQNVFEPDGMADFAEFQAKYVLQE